MLLLHQQCFYQKHLVLVYSTSPEKPKSFKDCDEWQKKPPAPVGYGGQALRHVLRSFSGAARPTTDFKPERALSSVLIHGLHKSDK